MGGGGDEVHEGWLAPDLCLTGARNLCCDVCCGVWVRIVPIGLALLKSLSVPIFVKGGF